jgi:TonB family protein
MSPTAKDLDVTNPSSTAPGTRSGSVGAQAEDTAGRPQPVPLEVPVTVNGARTVEGSDKREPFSETTQTVLVFGNGAVIRLASTVAAGQLLFLTNDKTKKEVVCQVVKSKNYRNVSGYVELEFTEAIPGFWGLRFPGERVAPHPSAPAAAPLARPAAPPAPRKIEAPAASSVPPRVESKPVPAPMLPSRSETISTSTLHAEAKPALNLPRAAEPKPVTTLPASAPHVINTPVNTHTNISHSNTISNTTFPNSSGLTDGWGSGLSSSARPTETSTPAPPKAPPAPASSQDSFDTLRIESERLQEQLASMLFAAEVPAKPVQAAPAPPAANRPSVAELSSKVLEMTRPPAPAAKVAPPNQSVPRKLESSLDAEEVKIPSWLEPLARNAATHGQNEMTVKEEATHADRVIEFEVQDVSAPAIRHNEETTTPAEEVLETHLHNDGSVIESTRGSKGKNKVMLIAAIAAGILLLVAGGTWYSRQSSAPSQTPAVAAAVPATETPTVVTPPVRSAAQTAPNRSNINSEPVPITKNAAPQTASQPAATEAQYLTGSLQKTAAAELSAYKKLAEPQPVVAAKKPSLGEVHLAAPKSNRSAGSAEAGDAGTGLNLTAETAPTGDAMASGFVGASSKQPAAPAVPLPVGGDVRAVRLLSSTPPVYPQLAKNQRVEGSVRIDALIDKTGRVSSMKVVSGPVLLHQAAMESLRQWRYQPAMLDGKPIEMRLTVTVQFHLQ